MTNIRQQISSNKFKSNLIVIGFVLFITSISWLFAEVLGYGLSFVGIALIFSGVTGLISYYFSDRIILSISQARPADRQRDFDFYTVTENLTMSARMPMPKLYVIEDSSMNAFATGRDPEHGVVVASRGLLDRLDRSEIEAVVAHELSHIRNYDIRLMAIVTILVGMVTLLADWFLRMSLWGGVSRDRDRNSGQIGVILMVAGFVLALLSPLIATLIKLAISRRREFLADASAVGLTKYPEGLARALEKLASDREPLEAANKATAHLYIVNPLTNLSRNKSVGLFANLFSTHPPIEERISRLRGEN